jgi:hypothetical protein
MLPLLISISSFESGVCIRIILLPQKETPIEQSHA